MIGSGPEISLAVPSGQRYSCRQCGWCCRWWKIEVSPAERARLASHDWSKESPRLRGVQLFWEHRLPFQPDPVVQTAQLRGQCVFLEDDGLCLIHKVMGEEAKPSTCRRFPLIAGFIGCEPLAALDYSCSSAVRNEGEPVERMARDVSVWLAEAARGLHYAPDPRPVLREGVDVSWRQYLSIEKSLVAIARNRGQPLSSRLATGLRLISGFDEDPLDATEGSLIPPMGHLAPMIADVEVPHTPTTGRGSGAIGYALAVASQSGRTYLSTLATTVDLQAASKVGCDIDNAKHDGLFTRFLVNYLLRKALLKTDTVEAGWIYLGACVGLIVWYAAASASIHGTPETNAEDLATGIQVVEKAFVP